MSAETFKSAVFHAEDRLAEIADLLQCVILAATEISDTEGIAAVVRIAHTKMKEVATSLEAARNGQDASA